MALPNQINNSSFRCCGILLNCGIQSWHLLQDLYRLYRDASSLNGKKKNIPCPMISWKTCSQKNIIRHPFFQKKTAHILRFSQTNLKTKLHYWSSILRAFSLCLEFGGNNQSGTSVPAPHFQLDASFCLRGACAKNATWFLRLGPRRIDMFSQNLWKNLYHTMMKWYMFPVDISYL